MSDSPEALDYSYFLPNGIADGEEDSIPTLHVQPHQNFGADGLRDRFHHDQQFRSQMRDDVYDHEHQMHLMPTSASRLDNYYASNSGVNSNGVHQPSQQSQLNAARSFQRGNTLLQQQQHMQQQLQQSRLNLGPQNVGLQPQPQVFPQTYSSSINQQSLYGYPQQTAFDTQQQLQQLQLAQQQQLLQAQLLRQQQAQVAQVQAAQAQQFYHQQQQHQLLSSITVPQTTQYNAPQQASYINSQQQLQQQQQNLMALQQLAAQLPPHVQVSHKQAQLAQLVTQINLQSSAGGLTTAGSIPSSPQLSDTGVSAEVNAGVTAIEVSSDGSSPNNSVADVITVPVISATSVSSAAGENVPNRDTVTPPLGTQTISAATCTSRITPISINSNPVPLTSAVSRLKLRVEKERVERQEKEKNERVAKIAATKLAVAAKHPVKVTPVVNKEKATSGGLAAVSLRALHRPVAVTVTSNAIKATSQLSPSNSSSPEEPSSSEAQSYATTPCMSPLQTPEKNADAMMKRNPTFATAAAGLHHRPSVDIVVTASTAMPVSLHHSSGSGSALTVIPASKEVHTAVATPLTEAAPTKELAQGVQKDKPRAIKAAEVAAKKTNTISPVKVRAPLPYRVSPVPTVNTAAVVRAMPPIVPLESVSLTEPVLISSIADVELVSVVSGSEQMQGQPIIVLSKAILPLVESSGPAVYGNLAMTPNLANVVFSPVSPPPSPHLAQRDLVDEIALIEAVHAKDRETEMLLKKSTGFEGSSDTATIPAQLTTLQPVVTKARMTAVPLEKPDQPAPKIETLATVRLTKAQAAIQAAALANASAHVAPTVAVAAIDVSSEAVDSVLSLTMLSVLLQQILRPLRRLASHELTDSMKIGSTSVGRMVQTLMRVASFFVQAVMQLHTFALQAVSMDRHVAFAYVFLFLFPTFDRYLNNASLTPTWTASCFAYGFLLQHFLYMPSSFFVVMMRTSLPVGFLLNVSSHSFLLDLNGGERLLAAFVLSALRTHDLSRPLLLTGLSLMIILAVGSGQLVLVQWLIALGSLLLLRSPGGELCALAAEKPSN